MNEETLRKRWPELYRRHMIGLREDCVPGESHEKHLAHLHRDAQLRAAAETHRQADDDHKDVMQIFARLQR